jgi:long-chain fatty acid transport protein
MGRAGVGTPKPCGDGSAIFYNPAGIGGMGTVASVGVTVISAFGGFEDDYTSANSDLQNSPIPIPHLYVTYGFTPKITAGLGVFVPYGLGTVWENTFEGRFNGYDNDLRSIYIQPTVAWKPHEMISFGAGLDVVMGSVKLTQRADLSEQGVPGQPITFGNLGIPFHTDLADAQLKAGGAHGIGGNFGILFEPGEGVSIGARYLTRVTLDYEGDVTFAQVENGLILPPQNPIALAIPGIDPAQPLPVDAFIATLGLFEPGAPLGPQKARTSLTMPDQFSLGVAVSPSDRFTLMGEWQWVNWSLFEQLEVDFDNAPDRAISENYSNTNGFRLGMEWLPTGGPFTLRGGYLYHEGAAPPEAVTPLLPEGARNEFTLGAGFRISQVLSADVAYQYLRQNKRRGRVREPEPGLPPSLDLNSGVYTFNAHLFGVTLVAAF